MGRKPIQVLDSIWGLYLRRKLTRLKVSQKEVCVKAGFSPQTLNRWWLGHSEPRARNLIIFLRTMAEIEDRPVEDLIKEMVDLYSEVERNKGQL
jgi:transcriptional regulator with XRE-family HTH domain